MFSLTEESITIGILICRFSMDLKCLKNLFWPTSCLSLQQHTGILWTFSDLVNYARLCFLQFTSF